MALAVQELGAMFLEHHEEAVKAWPKAKADKWRRISPLLPLFTDLYVRSREHEKFVDLTPSDRAGDRRPKLWTIVPDTSGNGNFVLIFAVNYWYTHMGSSFMHVSKKDDMFVVKPLDDFEKTFKQSPRYGYSHEKPTIVWAKEPQWGAHQHVWQFDWRNRYDFRLCDNLFSVVVSHRDTRDCMYWHCHDVTEAKRWLIVAKISKNNRFTVTNRIADFESGDIRLVLDPQPEDRLDTNGDQQIDGTLLFVGRGELVASPSDRMALVLWFVLT